MLIESVHDYILLPKQNRFSVINVFGQQQDSIQFISNADLFVKLEENSCQQEPEGVLSILSCSVGVSPQNTSEIEVLLIRMRRIAAGAEINLYLQSKHLHESLIWFFFMILGEFTESFRWKKSPVGHQAPSPFNGSTDFISLRQLGQMGVKSGSRFMHLKMYAPSSECI